MDSKAPGSGQTYPRDWAKPLLQTGKRIILAGGITPENLEEVLALRPYAIDLASGVERAPGIKDEAKLKALFAKG
ncbi:phosphoribosylanthranilate isomerase, partial [Staphylococcus aureus]|nr:phosphoribosylanthranilate isomerase [Staphylococcus aureus]